MSRDATLPLEDFIKAVQAQLDQAQRAMAIRARNAGLPLTFAVKDIAMELRAQVEFQAGQVRIRPAAAGDPNASVLHFAFTGITRPMIDENAAALAETPDDPGLETLDSELTEEERRRLEWAGIRTVGKLRELQETGADREVARVATLPVDRLRRALARTSAPMVDEVLPVAPGPGDTADQPALIRLRGRNLRGAGLPRVAIGGRAVPVLHASEHEILLAPAADQWAGELRLEPEGGRPTALAFDLSAAAPAPLAGGESGR